MSRQIFDFSPLLRDYATAFTVITQSGGGYDDAGDWRDGTETRTEMTGAIIAFRESKVFRSEGKITSQDKRLFMRQPLPDALMGAQVVHDGHRYMIESETENAVFTGVYSYLMRHVSAFEGACTLGEGLIGNAKMSEHGGTGGMSDA